MGKIAGKTAPNFKGVVAVGGTLKDAAVAFARIAFGKERYLVESSDGKSIYAMNKLRGIKYFCPEKGNVYATVSNRDFALSMEDTEGGDANVLAGYSVECSGCSLNILSDTKIGNCPTCGTAIAGDEFEETEVELPEEEAFDGDGDSDDVLPEDDGDDVLGDDSELDDETEEMPEGDDLEVEESEDDEDSDPLVEDDETLSEDDIEDDAEPMDDEDDFNVDVEEVESCKASAKDVAVADELTGDGVDSKPRKETSEGDLNNDAGVDVGQMPTPQNDDPVTVDPEFVAPPNSGDGSNVPDESREGVATSCGKSCSDDDTQFIDDEGSVDIDMLDDTETEDGDEVDVEYSTSAKHGKARWIVTVASTPVATVNEDEVSKANKDIFHTDAFAKVVSAVIAKSGVAGCRELGFKSLKVSAPLKSVIASQVAKDTASEQVAIAKTQKDTAVAFVTCMGIAAAGLNKGFFNDKPHMLKAELYEELSSLSIPHPEKIIDRVFAKQSDEYHRTLYEISNDLMGKSEDVRSELSKAIIGMNYKPVVLAEDEEDEEVEDLSLDVDGSDAEEMEEDQDVASAVASRMSQPFKTNKDRVLSSDTKVQDVNARIKNVCANLGKKRF